MSMLTNIFGKKDSKNRKHVIALVQAASNTKNYDKTELLLHFAKKHDLTSEEFNSIVAADRINTGSKENTIELSQRERKKLLFNLIKVALLGKHISTEVLEVIEQISKAFGYADQTIKELIISLNSRRIFGDGNHNTLNMVYHIINKNNL